MRLVLSGEPTPSDICKQIIERMSAKVSDMLNNLPVVSNPNLPAVRELAKEIKAEVMGTT